jgi:hypothetical protein
MNAAITAQLEKLRSEVLGEFITFYTDAKQTVVCLIPTPDDSLPDALGAWDRVSTPTLLHLDGTGAVRSTIRRRR